MNKQSFFRSVPVCSAMLMLVALIWGSGFIYTNLAILSGMPPSLILALRFAIPVAVMAFLFRGELAVATPKDIRFGCTAGVILFLAFFTQTYGICYTTPANSAFLTSTNVIIVPLLSWLFFRQFPGVRALFCAALCFVGAAVLAWSPGVGVTFNLGDWLTLLCALLYAGHIAFLGLSGDGIGSAGVLNFLQLLVAAVLSLLYFLLMERGDFTFAALRQGILPVIYLGLFCTGLCFFLQSWAQRYLPPARTAVLLCCEGLFGSLFSVLWGFDTPTLTFVMGGAIILGSVVLVQLDWPRKKQPA